jgi:hypothetical protein
MRGVILISCSVVVLILAAASLAGSTKSASVTIGSTVGPDGNCYVTDTATWTGYQVNRVRHVFYRRTGSGDLWESFTTTGYPQGVSYASGSFASQSTVPAYAGETWYVHAIFRSNGGAHLAEADSPNLVVPTSCPARPV